MTGTNPNESITRDAGTVARWIAVVAAGLCVLIIILNLVRPKTTGWMSPRTVAPLGLLLSMGSIVATQKAAKIVLAVCGATLVTAALLLDVLGV